jgi:UDP-glucuronate 4-epimerase
VRREDEAALSRSAGASANPCGGRLGRVVVTGSSGFLGRHVAAALSRAGDAVVGLDRRPPGRDGSSAAAWETRPLDLVQQAVAPLLEGVSVVFHFAGAAGVRDSWGGRFAAYLGANVLATQRLLEACERAGVPRLVFASSSSVYGQAPWLPAHEDSPACPASPYGVTKLAAERLTLAYAHRPGARTSVVALRYFTVYGPDQRPDMLVGRLLRAAVTGEPAPLYGDGSQRRDFTYVDDAVNATIAAAHVLGRAEVVNVGTGVSTSIRDLVDLVAEVSGRPVPLRAAADQVGDVECTQADLRRARLVLGYSPAVHLREGLTRHLDHLRCHAKRGSRPPAVTVVAGGSRKGPGC